MLPGKRTSEGAIYVLQGPPPAGTPLVGGIAVSDDGAIYASNASSLPGFPTNTVAPSISGTPVVGQTLTCTPGTWTGTPTPTVTRQWRANGVNIPGATGTTYVVQLAYANQNIRCLETATNSVGTASAQSNFLTIFGAPVNTTAPIITGNAEVGSVLTTGNGTWVSTPTATYVYAWFSDGVVIPGQTANTYTTLAGDIGKTITSRVTATNPAGSVQANSQNGILVAAIPANPPINTVAPVISGNTPAGSVLTTTNGTWTGDAPITYTYTWRADNVSIPGATSQTYTTVAGDIGKSIVCRVTAANVAGTANATSNAIVVTGAVFSPASLFASGEQGAWYDPSDLTTMFQDRFGTTPVTADGQTVGLILDKSKGMVIGSPVFTEDGVSASDWAYPGTNGGSVAAVSGEIKLTCGNPLSGLTDRLCYSTISGLSVGTAYKVVSTFRNITDTTGAKISVTGSFVDGDTTGVYTENFTTSPVQKTMYFVATSTTMYFRLIAMNGGSSATVGLSSATIQSIAGNHATAPNDAARPLYKTSGGLHWLQFDGVNNALSTAEINFTATDKLDMFSGVKANTGNIDSYLCGVGGNASVIGSAHVFSSLSGGGNKIYQYTKGTGSESRGNFALTYPFTKVLTSLFDTAQAASADQNKLRLNASPVTLTYDTGPTSAGNYGNFSLYVGARSGATNYFPGNIYALIVLGRLAATQEITDTETWVNGKTGAY